MIISATLSKPSKKCEEILGRPYQRIKIRAANSANGTAYFLEMFTEKQAFHQQKTTEELQSFLNENAGITFKNCIIRTDTEETTILANKKGEITKLTKKIKASQNEKNSSSVLKSDAETSEESRNNDLSNHSGVANRILLSNHNGANSFNKKKNYLIQEGNPVPFMVLLGIMNGEGKVINSRYDKFKQINRFLEFIDDVLPSVTKNLSHPLRIADFGCGKSYLTFAVHYYLTQIKGLEVEIIGLDLKKDVIDYCNDIAKKLGCKGLEFDTGNIADYSYKNAPDIVITLHACDTATDFALEYAVRRLCRAILSVPCCQHEINLQLGKKSSGSPFAPLLKYGIIKERFAALATDALRGEYLESMGYDVQMLEFIDMENTPKNLMIRAVLNEKQAAKNENITAIPALDSSKTKCTEDKTDSAESSISENKPLIEANNLTDALNVQQTLKKLLKI